MNELHELNQRHGIQGLRFEAGSGGLTRAVMKTSVASGELYLHGAHVTQFQPEGHSPVLWMSEQSYFESGKPIRGGVPLCFPWFGPNSKDSTAPAHGLARTALWDVVATHAIDDDGIAIELSKTLDAFKLNYRVEFGKILQLSLKVGLLDDIAGPRSFEEALHTYFTVGDIKQVTIEGLEAYGYLDKVGGVTKRTATQESIRFTSETDRVYLDTNSKCTLRDPSLKRVITVSQTGSRSTVVWNPWVDKSARMPDFGDHEWPKMVCIETANVGDQAITIQPGQTQTMTARIEVSHSPS